MLCTFTTKDGALVIRSDDIRSISDSSRGTLLLWVIGDAIHDRLIEGTASENRDRIQQEELDLIAKVESHRYETQKRWQTGYPVPPVERGRQAR
jgi:hypothetical protein